MLLCQSCDLSIQEHYFVGSVDPEGTTLTVGTFFEWSHRLHSKTAPANLHINCSEFLMPSNWINYYTLTLSCWVCVKMPKPFKNHNTEPLNPHETISFMVESCWKWLFLYSGSTVTCSALRSGLKWKKTGPVWFFQNLKQKTTKDQSIWTSLDWSFVLE